MTTQTQPQKYLVLGLGMTGYSIVEYLSSTGAEIDVVDSRDIPPYLAECKKHYPHVRIFTETSKLGNLEQYDQVFRSPGIEFHEVANMSGDIELFGAAAAAPVIGITGSNGKSTVTMLVSEMIRASGKSVATGGNIGTPALDLLKKAKPDVYVLELSSFQLEVTHSLHLIAATVLNISEDHMDRYVDFESYRLTKNRIFDHAEAVVLNRDDHDSSALLAEHDNAVTFGLSAPRNHHDFGLQEIDNSWCLVHGDRVLCATSDVVLKGQHNIANILAAMALVSASGIELTSEVIHSACQYAGLPHRCEWVGEWNDVKWINDSKGTNIGSTVAAIKGFDEPIVLIAGGEGKGADFAELANALDGRVKFALLFGRDASLIAEKLSQVVPCECLADLESIVARAAQVAESGDLVLFSPACASFDMFDNYMHRGLEFTRLVQEVQV